MDCITIIKKGENIQHCINIPKELLKENLEITIKPLRKKKGKSIHVKALYVKYKDINPFQSIDNPVQWQHGERNEWP